MTDAAAAQTRPEPPLPGARALLVMVTLLLATAMASLDSSFMPLAFADMIDDLDSSTNQIVWVALGYLVAATGPMLLAARVADAFGHARLFQAGATLYSLAMIACAFAPDVPELIGLRLVQGFGMALFLPTTFTIATRIFGAERRGRALGWLQAANALGFILGPIFAGWLLDAYDWRATFWSRIPLAALIIVLAFAALGLRRPMALAGASRRFDFAGAVYLTLAMFGVLFGCTQLPVEENWRDPWSWLVFVAGFVFAVLFLRHERRVAEPLIDLELFTRSREFTRAAIAFATMFASLPLTLFVLPIVLINALEMRAWDVGLIMAVSALFTTLMSPVSGWASDRFRPEIMSSTGALVRGAGYLMLLAVTVDSDVAGLLPALIVIGIGTGLFFSPNNALLMAHAPPERAGMVSGLFGTLRQSGYALGFALIASLFAVIQKNFELDWVYTSLDQLPAASAASLAAIFQAGGIWSPELLIFILRVAVLACTAILALSLLNSLPRLQLSWRRQFGAAALLAALASGGSFALGTLMPVGMTVATTAAGDGAGEPPPAVAPFGMAQRAAVAVAEPQAAPAAGPFAQYCSACHGAGAEGVPGLGVNLHQSAFVRGQDLDGLKRFLRAGRDPSSPENRTGRAMPAFGWLPDATLDELARYLRETAASRR
ncbi:MAG: MFS transporter [Gammaproteobacteria bacterium]|nr:MFS transporter [Gammaproteobacteria bacterium]